MVQLNFNANTVAPSTPGSDIFESGVYGFQIIESKTQATKKQDGTMLVFTASCIDEGQRGKRITIRLNVQNPNPQAVEIAFAELSAICHVTGQLVLTDTQQLHGKPFKIQLEKVPREDKPDQFQNDIRAYFDMNDNAPGKANVGGGTAQAPQAPVAPNPTQPAPQAPTPAAPQAAAISQPLAAPSQPAGNQDASGAAPQAPASSTPENAPAAPWQTQAPAAPAANSGNTPPWQQG